MATPLEPLFDPSLVAFGAAASPFARLVAAQYLGEEFLGFAFALIWICWAWINYSWCSSAYDTDDWFYRITTMVQMIGVIVLARVAQWLRVSEKDPAGRRTAPAYLCWVSIAQVGRVVLAIVALGEGIFGTVTTVSAIVERQSWSAQSIIVIIEGVGLTFGMWWAYFILPSGPLLALRLSERSVWGYSHILVYAAIAAMGAGLHVAAHVIRGETTIGTLGGILAVSIYSMIPFARCGYFLEEWDSLHLWLMIGMITALAIVVGFETSGHRHQTAALERLEAESTSS